MKKSINILLVILFSFISFSSFSQRSDRYSYKDEFLWGVNKNTTGGLIGGFVFRKSRKISDKMFESIGVELMNVKHSKETRWNSVTGTFFIYGKLNYLYSIRPQYGREIILFDKSPDQGVEIKLNLAAGPSFGLLSPYYVEIGEFGTNSYKVPFDKTIQYGEILGPGNLFQGLGESSIKMGANAKVGLSFEMGTIKSQVTGFEIGALFDAYLGDINLMVNTQKSSFFPTAYISLFYGMRK